MNLTDSKVQPKCSAVDTTADSAKLLSLLALATGAVAMPQTSNADIVFTDLSANPVHVGPLGSTSYIINNLPGNAQIGFHAHTLATPISSSRWVTAKQELAAGYVRLLTKASFVIPAAAGQTWNQIKAGAGVFATVFGTAAFANYYGAGPTFGGGAHNFSDRYYMFEFKDSTQGNAMRYGWIWVGMANPVGGNGPDLTINGYAFETTGAVLGAGLVPEPSAPALLALGALVFGAKGVRKWRKNKASESTASPG